MTRNVCRVNHQLFLLFALLLLAGTLNAATITTTGSGNWSSTTPNAPWPGGIIPAPGDDIIVGNGFTLTVDALGAPRTCNSLSGGNGSIISLNAALTINTDLSIGDGTTFNANNTLQVTGSTAVGGGVSGSITFTTTGTKTFVGLVTINNGATWSNATESVVFRGGITSNGTFTAGTGVQTFNTNSQTITGTFAIPRVTVTGGAVELTNTNTLTVNTSLSGTGRIIQVGGATLNIGGTSAIRNMTADAAGNTVNYTGADQTVKGVGYANLVLSGSGTKSLQAGTTSITGDLVLSGTVSVTGVTGLTIGGDVTIGSGTSFTAGSFTHTVAGDWTNNGTFTGTGSKINFNGAAQNITGGSTTFNDLQLNGSGTKTLSMGPGTTISGVFSIDNGAVASLSNANTYTSNSLFLGGAIQQAGTWGSLSSSPQATNKTDIYFSGNGLVTVATGAFSYYSISDGDWNLNTTWSTTGFGGVAATGTPGPTDYVFIGDGFAVTVSGSETCSALLYDAGTSVTNTLTINPGGSLTVATVTIPQAVTSGSNILDVGAGTLNVGNIDFTASGSGADHQLVLSTGTATVSGNITGIGSSSTIQFTGAGLLQVGGSMFTSANGTLTSVAGSTVEYNGAGQTVQALGYANLTLSGSGTKTLAGVTTVGGDLTVGDGVTFTANNTILVTGATTVGGGVSGTLSFTTTGTKTFVGLVTINNGATWSNTSESVVFRGGITSNGTFTAGTGVHTFNTNSQTLAGTFAIPRVTVTGGAVELINTNTLAVNTALSGSGRIIQGAGSILNIGGTSAITGMTADAAGNTVNYTGADQTVKGVEYVNLVLSGSGTKSLQAGTTSITGDLVLSGTVSVTGVTGLTIGGDVTIGSGTSFTAGSFTHTVAGDWTNNGTFTGTGSKINFNGATQNISGASTTFNNLTLSGSGIKVFGVSTKIDGELSISTGVKADLGAITTHIANTLILNGALQSASGTWGSLSSAAINKDNTYFLDPSIGEITIAVGGSNYYSISDGDWNLNTTWSTTGFGGVAATGTPGPTDYVFIGDGFAVTVSGSETCSALLYDAGTSVTNTLTINPGGSLTVATVTIPQAVTSGSNILDVGAGTLNVGNIDFTASGSGADHQLVLSTGTATVSGNITGIGSSSTIQFTGAGLLQVGGSMFTSANGTLTSVAGSTVEYNGAGQTVQALGYANLTLSGSGTKTLAGVTTVGGDLTVGDGVTFTANNTILVTGATTVGGGVSGTLSFTTTGTKTFVGLVTINNGATWSNTSESVVFRGGITSNGTFTAGTGVHTFNTNSQTLAGTFAIPRVTVTGGAVELINTNTLAVNTALSGSGRIIQGAGSILNIGGTSAITGMTADAAGNTVNYTGADQTVKGVEYVNLVLSGSGTKSLQAGTTSITGDLVLSGTVSVTGVTGLTIGGDVTIGSGTSFTAGSFTHTVAGDWINNGTFDASTGTVAFAGTAAQNIQGTSATTFNNIAINNTVAFVNVQSDQNLRGILTLSPNASFDADGTSNTSIFTLLSTNDSPAEDASIAELPVTAQFEGDVIVQRYFSAADDTDRFISTPISNATVSQLQAASPLGSFPVTGGFPGSSFPCTGCINNGHSFRYYTESVAGIINKGYTAFITSSATTLVPGVGYDSYMWNGVSNTIVSFKGTINRGAVNLGVSGGITHTANGVPSADGYNLVGNPYPSAIQWNNGAGWNRTNIDPTIFAWDVVGGVWRSYNADTQIGDITDGVIATGQAFWVYASTPGVGSITINEQAKSNTGSGTYYRKGSNSMASLTMSLTYQGVTDNAFLLIKEKATLGYDLGLDAPKLELGIERLSVSFMDQQGNKLVHYAVSTLPDAHDIPISIFAQTDGELSLSFNATSEFLGFEDYYLVDSYLGKTSKISEGAYSFTIDSKTQSDRFYLSKNPNIGEERESKLFLSCYPNPASERFTVEVNSEDVQQILLLDDLGRVLDTIVFKTDKGVSRGNVNMTFFPQGVYIIKVSAAGRTYIERVVKN